MRVMVLSSNNWNCTPEVKWQILLCSKFRTRPFARYRLYIVISLLISKWCRCTWMCCTVESSLQNRRLIYWGKAPSARQKINDFSKYWLLDGTSGNSHRKFCFVQSIMPFCRRFFEPIFVSLGIPLYLYFWGKWNVRNSLQMLIGSLKLLQMVGLAL